MDAQLKKIRVEHFKSLRQFEIELGKFNVLIGPNGSGKTNVLELFKFINLCINPVGSTPHPFVPWWGFDNIIWSRYKELRILFSLQYSAYDAIVDYTAGISGKDGKFSFIMETFYVENLVYIDRDFDNVELYFDEKFLEVNKENIFSLSSRVDYDRLRNTVSHSVSLDKSFLRTHGEYDFVDADDKLCFGRFESFTNDQDKKLVSFVSPLVHYNDENVPLFPEVEKFLTSHNFIIFLRQLNLNIMRQPSAVGKTGLAEDGDGLINLLYTWYTDNNGALPSRIIAALDELFPDWRVSFTVTEDDRIILNVNVRNLTLSPTSIPDGFYKLLCIMAAVELNPKILLIDEIDTSLHAKIIEYLLSTFKTGDSTVIITTHSPLVIDLVDLEDLILLERKGNETRSHRILEPDKMREKLKEKGLTPSDSWLYAEL